MPAKASVPVKRFRIDRFRGHGPLLQGWWMRHLPRKWESCCRSGPCPRKRRFRLERFHGIDRFRGHGPLLQGWWMRHLPRKWVSCCRSGPCPRKRRFRLRRFHGIHRFRGHGPLLQGWWMRHLPRKWESCCRSGPCPRKRRFRVKRFRASTAFGAMPAKAMNRYSRRRMPVPIRHRITTKNETSTDRKPEERLHWTT
jgi:hypothetical protein